MTLDELNELDLSDLFADVGSWPLVAKLITALLIAGGVAVGGYYLDTEDQYKRLAAVEKQEIGLREEFSKKQLKAANLEAYKKQLAEMEESFGAMLRQLPNKTEIPDLIIDVSQTGLAAGLEFDLFQPQGEVAKEFYAEKPIKLTVRGGYHEFGEFVSGLAALPRIVTIHDVRISGSAGKLVMNATAKTYRYIDEDSQG